MDCLVQDRMQMEWRRNCPRQQANGEPLNCLTVGHHITPPRHIASVFTPIVPSIYTILVWNSNTSPNALAGFIFNALMPAILFLLPQFRTRLLLAPTSWKRSSNTTCIQQSTVVCTQSLTMVPTQVLPRSYSINSALMTTFLLIGSKTSILTIFGQMECRLNYLFASVARRCISKDPYASYAVLCLTKVAEICLIL
jgi:hypothetical protein